LSLLFLTKIPYTTYTTIAYYLYYHGLVRNIELIWTIGSFHTSPF
jgi:hypothetical protein